MFRQLLTIVLVAFAMICGFLVIEARADSTDSLIETLDGLIAKNTEALAKTTDDVEEKRLRGKIDELLVLKTRALETRDRTRPATKACCTPKVPCSLPTYVVDSEELPLAIMGPTVSTCHGPITTGLTLIEGRGKESSRFAAVLAERVLETNERMYNRGVDAQETCRAPQFSCVGTRSCVARTCTGASYRPASSGCGSCSGRSGGFCPCSSHAAQVRRMYGSYADPRLYTCLCAPGCPECAGRMVYIDR